MGKPKQVEPPEPTMRELLLEQVRVIIEALPDDMTFEDWNDTANDFEVFDFGDNAQREAVSFAYGYLRGAHEMADLTLLELLWDHDIFEADLNALEREARAQ